MVASWYFSDARLALDPSLHHKKQEARRRHRRDAIDGPPTRSSRQSPSPTAISAAQLALDPYLFQKSRAAKLPSGHRRHTSRNCEKNAIDSWYFCRAVHFRFLPVSKEARGRISLEPSTTSLEECRKKDGRLLELFLLRGSLDPSLYQWKRAAASP